MRNQRGIFEKIPGSGVWWIHWYDASGRRHREKAGTKSGAIALYHKRKHQALEGRKLPEKLRSAGVSFAELVKDALEHSRARKVPECYHADIARARILREWFPDWHAEQITPQEIEQRLNQLAEEGRQPATINRYRALLSLIYSLGMRNGKVAANPARLVPLRRENNARVRFLDEEEESKLREKIRELRPEREAEFDLALHTGMRRGEQYRLRWQDVDLKHGFLAIPRSKHGERRYIAVNSVARRALLVLRERSDGIGYVCPGTNAPRGRDWRRWFEGTVKEACIRNFRWHDLRHTFASRLVMAGVDLRSVQELLGHKTIQMTMRYSHLAPAHLQEAVERIATATTTATSSARPSRSEAVSVA